MADAGTALQAAVYTRLNGAMTSLAGGVLPVYDHVAQGTAYPYVSLDNATMTPDDPLARSRDLRTVNLSVWSDHAGKAEVLHVLGQMYDLLHEQRLPMQAGFRMVRARVIRQNATIDADGVTYMGALTVQARVEHE